MMVQKYLKRINIFEHLVRWYKIKPSKLLSVIFQKLWLELNFHLKIDDEVDVFWQVDVSMEMPDI